MAQALTAKTIEKLKPVRTRREIPDAYLPGLYLVVQPSGAKAWAVRYRHNSRTRKHTLGSYPAIPLKSARELGAKALRAAAEGRDPGREKAHNRATSVENSIEKVAGRFIEQHCHRLNRPRTARETERLLRSHVLPRWRRRLVQEITRRDVLELLDRIVEGGTPIAANRVLSAIRKLFSWCIQRDIIPYSPCAGVKPPSAERSRDRVLSDHELSLIWLAVHNLGFPFGSLVQLLMLTGQRRDEVAHMAWTELDLNARLWILPAARVKNDREHTVPLSQPVVALLKALPRIQGSPFVLTTTGKAPASNYSKGKRRLDALLPPGMTPWRLHDLRRTVASGMARLGINLPVIEKVLNHSSGSFAGIVGVYQRHEFAGEKRNALEAWASHINLLTSSNFQADRAVAISA